LLSRAKLAIVYDPSSAAYRKLQPALEAWVRGGGKLLIWDPLSRAGADSLLEGITFWADPAHEPARKFAYADAAYPLLTGLSGATIQTGPLLPGMRAASPAWRELAYTVVMSGNAEQYARPWDTFGPRWTSLINTVRMPVMVAREYGAGTVIVAQMGVWNTPPKAQMNADRLQEVPPHLRKLAENLMNWAGRKGSATDVSRVGP